MTILTEGLLAACSFFLQDSQETNSLLALLLPGAKEVESVQRALSAEEQAQIEKSIGAKLGDPARFSSFHKAKAVPPGENQAQELHVVFVPIEGMKASVLGIAASEKGEVAAIEIFASKSADRSWAVFLEQFKGPWGVRLTSNSANSPSLLAEMQKKASAKGNEEAKKLDALLSQRQLMWENGNKNQLLHDQLRAKSAQAASVAKDYAKFLGQLVEFSPKMSVILEPAELKIYQEHFKEMKKSADILASAASKNDWDNAQKNLRGIQNHCGKCHGWDGTHYNMPLEGAMRKLREDLGIGNGYFVVGFDLHLPEAVKKEEAQPVANAVKAGLWALKFSFGKN